MDRTTAALIAALVAVAAAAGVVIGVVIETRSDAENDRVVVEHCDEWDEFFGGCDD